MMHPEYLRAAVSGYSALLVGWIVWPVAPGWPTAAAAAAAGVIAVAMSRRMFQDLDDDT
jgi:hypothetical protein